VGYHPLRGRRNTGVIEQRAFPDQGKMTAAEQTILIVDDDDSVLFYLQEVLGALGFTLLCASTYEEGLKLARTAAFAVAIIDKNLPGDKTGLDLVRVLSEERPLVRSMIHTGYPSRHSAIEALQLGAFDYLEKPIDNELLFEKVRRAVNVYVIEREREEMFDNYESLFELIPGIVWFVARNGVVERVSKQGATLLEYEPREMVGVGYDSLVIDPDGTEQDGQWVFKERRTGPRADQRKLVRLRSKTGKVRIFEMRSCGAYEPGSVHTPDNYKGTLAVGWDITDNVRLLEELQQAQKMDALGRLASGVAHDFNNLLCVIGPTASILRDDLGPDHRSIREVDVILSTADRAAALTKHLLLFSRKQMTTPVRVDVRNVVTHLQGMLERLVREDIVCSMVAELKTGSVYIDPHQLEQVIVNLAVNAADAMPGGGKLEVHVSNRSIDSAYASGDPKLRPGKFVLISVTDNGQGIPKNVRERVFEPFFTTKEEGKGTGLGLSIVYGIVNQAGGFVSLYTEEGTGTTVKVFLPRYEGRVENSSGRIDIAPRSGSETILVVDDDAAVLRIAAQVLTRAGYDVLESSSLVAALETIGTGARVDLLLTDMVMPGGGGAELAGLVRDRIPQLPVLFMSGYPSGLTLPDVENQDSAFVEKPFTAQKLLAEVRRLLDAGQ